MVENSGNLTSVSLSRSNSPSNSDEDEVSTVQEFNDYCGSQALDLPALGVSNLATTVVKMENNCSNVEINPVTQVTVNQYFRDAVHPRPDGSIPTISKHCTQSGSGEAELNAESKPHNTPNKKFVHAIASAISWKLRVLLVLTVAVIIVVITVALTVMKKGDTPDTDIRTNTSGPEATSHDLGNDIHILARDRWNGRPILDGYQKRTLVHPIKLVIIGHTVSSQCMTIESCSSSLQSIQSSHVSNFDWLDIGYNFLIGGDGNIYQALGWDIRNYLRNNSIQIQFMGNYIYDHVQDKQREALKALLDYGVKLGKIDKDYFMVGQNQVMATQSPGRNLLAEIKTWSHYSNQTLT